MKKYILILGFIYVDADTKLFGQEIPAIQTDRPDQTECPFIVPAKYFQMENGFLLTKEDENTNSYLFPSTLMRYGLSSSFELRLITEYALVETKSENIAGFFPVTIGFKVKLSEEKGLIPTTAFIGHLTIPKFASEEFKLNYYAPAFRFTMQHTLTTDWSFSYNLGARWNGDDSKPIFIYTAAIGYSLTGKTGMYLELFGFAPQHSKSLHMFDGGFTYLLKKNIQLDLSAGYQISQNAPEYYYSFGFSFRIPD